VALEFARGGFPVVIVNPTAPVGDHDVKPTPTGKIVADFLSGGMPAFIDTGLNVVDVRDVAAGHLQACERGRAGERYILGSENLTLAESSEAGEDHRPPGAHRAAPVRGGLVCGCVQHGMGGGHRQAAARASERGSHGPEEDVGDAREGAARAGFEPGPAETALARAVEWFQR